ncbi:hypothetical protein EDC96DRAFT_570259 [Choanephora cucurbitarum]|nr:hypothetical protein EDC96DRAFT_570259 [Choanephora cucurbitarum]
MVPKYISNNSIRDVVHSTENLADFCLNNLTYLIINTRIEVLFNRKQKSWSVVLVSTESNFCAESFLSAFQSSCGAKLLLLSNYRVFELKSLTSAVLYRLIMNVINLASLFRPNSLLVMFRFPGQCLTSLTLLLPFCVSNKRFLIVLRYYYRPSIYCYLARMPCHLPACSANSVQNFLLIRPTQIPSIVRLILPSIPSDAPSISTENKHHFYS